MPYATTEDITHACGGQDRYVQLFDWNEDAVADSDVVARAQTLADGMIDGYARRRYATPIANPSATLRAFAAELVVYQARKIRGVIGEADIAAQERAQREWLESLAAGRISPSDPEPARPLNSTVSVVQDMSDTNRDAWRLIL